MKVRSIQVGKPRNVKYKDQTVSTGIFKDPVSGPVMVRTLNIDGDGQADLKVHGGAEKAVYGYSFDVYSQWKKLRPQDEFPFGAMGENLTVDSFDESTTYVGDTFEIGEAIIQAAQPRLPCQKLAIKFNDTGILKQFMEIGRPGVYYRVIKEGMIQSGDVMKLVDRESIRLSIMELFRMSKLEDQDRIQKILKIKSLSQNWRKKFELWLL